MAEKLHTMLILRRLINNFISNVKFEVLSDLRLHVLATRRLDKEFGVLVFQVVMLMHSMAGFFSTSGFCNSRNSIACSHLSNKTCTIEGMISYLHIIR